MHIRHTHKFLTTLGLVLLGAGYFSIFAELDAPLALRNYLILVPVQVGILVYLLWWQRREA